MSLARLKLAASAAVVGMLAACGGGGGGSSTTFQELSARYAGLANDPSYGTTGELTGQAQLDGLRGTSTYDGLINIGVGQPSGGERAYFGDVRMTVNFTAGPDTISGRGDNFYRYDNVSSPNASLPAASGQMNFTDGLTTDSNETLGEGFAGNFSGTIEGVALTGTFDGSFTGDSAQGMLLYLDGDGSGSLGVGILFD